MAEDNTPTNVVDDVIKNKGTINEWFDEAYSKFESQGELVAGRKGGQKRLLKYSDLEDFLINEKGLSTELTDKLIQDIKDGVFAPAFPEAPNPKNRGALSLDFIKAEGLADVGIGRNLFHMEAMQKYLDNIYTTKLPEAATAVSELSYTDRQPLQDNFYKSLKNSDDVVEIYLRQVSRVNVPAESVYFRPELVQEVPGFYTEPIGGLSSGDMASGGGIRPTENYYRLEVNKNNLLIDVPGFDFNNELKTKLDWNLLEKELGINYSEFKGQRHSYQSFQSKLKFLAQELGIDNTKLYSTLRKAGYEGTVGYVNRQVEVVLLDPNDDLGIGKKVNFENSTIDDFYNNNQTVNQLDELVIKPTNVVDDLAPESAVDNIINTTTNVVDNLPLETVVKTQAKNLISSRAKNLATPSGALDAVDVWEMSVLGMMLTAIAYKEYDEIPTIITNKGIDMFNAMTSPYNIPPVPKQEYNLDYNYIKNVLDTGEKYMPTDIIIKKVGDVVKGAAETGAVTGFGYVPPNLTKADTMEKTQIIQPGVQEEKMFEQSKPQKGSGAGSGVKIL